MSLGNWEGEEDEDAEPEELPDWSAEIIPASDGKARLFLCVFSMPFCRRCKKAFYLHGVCTSLCAIFALVSIQRSCWPFGNRM